MRKAGAVRSVATGVLLAAALHCPAASADSAVQGVTPTTLKLGVVVTTGTQPETGAFGGGHRTPTDVKQMWLAALDDVNSHGGIAGRRVVPVFAESDADESWEPAWQRNCALLVQDNRVFATVGVDSQLLTACMSTARRPLISDAVAGESSAAIRRNPMIMHPAALALDRAAKVTLDGLQAAGWFKGWDPLLQVETTEAPAIGVLAWDQNGYHDAVEQVVAPYLRSRKLTLAGTAYVPVTDYRRDLDDDGLAAGVASALARFATAGVSHVLILDGAAGRYDGTVLTRTYLDSAVGAAYRPRLGLNSYSGGTWVAGSARSQALLTGAVLTGWLPAIDVAPQDDANAQSPWRRRCQSVMRKGGVAADDPNALVAELATCDAVSFLKASVERARPLTWARWMAAVSSLGRSYRSPLVGSTAFDGAHHDGVATYRAARFEAACGCFRYAIPPRRVTY